MLVSAECPSHHCHVPCPQPPTIFSLQECFTGPSSVVQVTKDDSRALSIYFSRLVVRRDLASIFAHKPDFDSRNQTASTSRLRVSNIRDRNGRPRLGESVALSVDPMRVAITEATQSFFIQRRPATKECFDTAQVVTTYEIGFAHLDDDRRDHQKRLDPISCHRLEHVAHVVLGKDDNGVSTICAHVRHRNDAEDVRGRHQA